jgi:hypothetical protein
MLNRNPETPRAPELNPALKNLDILIGAWDLEGIWPHDPPITLHGRASFQWIEGGAFMLYHTQLDRPEFPGTTAIIGPDDAAGTYSMLYFDSRGVSRIYEMSLNEGVWKLWRNWPGFSQRFIGRFSEDQDTITSRWEKSTNGLEWEHDFDLVYKRVK